MPDPVFQGALRQHLQRGARPRWALRACQARCCSLPQLLEKTQPSPYHRCLPLETQILNAEHAKGAPASPCDINR